jgi:hypothetical protein
VDVAKLSQEQANKSRADATTTFLQGAGAHWPGGVKNRELLGMQLASMGLADAEDKVGALSAAFAELKR